MLAKHDNKGEKKPINVHTHQKLFKHCNKPFMVTTFVTCLFLTLQ